LLRYSLEKDGALGVDEVLGVDPPDPLERPHEVRVDAPEVAGGRRLEMRLWIERLPLVLGQQLLDLLRQRPARGSRLLLQPQQPVKPLQEPLPLPDAPDLRGAGRHPDQAELLADADVGIGREIERHLENPLDQLHRGLVRHPGAPAQGGRQAVPAELLKGRLDLVEVAAADAGDLAGPADVLEFVGQC